MEKPKFIPLQDFIVIKKVEHQGKIQLISNNTKEADVFMVQVVGPGYWQGEKFIEPSVKKGDRVFIVGNIYEMDHSGQKYVLARAREVVGVLA